MIAKKYDVKDEDELLDLIDDDPDKLKGWEGPIDVHLRSVHYLPEKTRIKKRLHNK